MYLESAYEDDQGTKPEKKNLELRKADWRDLRIMRFLEQCSYCTKNLSKVVNDGKLVI